MARLDISKIDPQKYYRDFLLQDLRPDGRELDEFRPMSINVKSLSNADGSAIVKIGDTTVVCGIKAELARPKPETPTEGFLIANVDLPPLCSPQFQPGPPSDEAQVATCFLTETLQASGLLRLTDLCLCPDVLAWVLHLDVVCLNHDGGVLDASVAAAVAALRTLTLPRVNFDVETGRKDVDLGVRTPLPVQGFPVSTTFAVFENNKIVNDPTWEEETLSTGTLTVTVRGDTGEPCGVRQPGTQPLRPEQLQACVAEAVRRTTQVTKLVGVALQSPER